MPPAPPLPTTTRPPPLPTVTAPPVALLVLPPFGVSFCRPPEPAGEQASARSALVVDTIKLRARMTLPPKHFLSGREAPFWLFDRGAVARQGLMARKLRKLQGLLHWHSSRAIKAPRLKSFRV